MTTKRKNRKLRKTRKSKIFKKIKKLRKTKGGCEKCTDYHGPGSPASQWTQGPGAQTWYKGGSNNHVTMNEDIFKHKTDSSFYSSTK